MKLKLLMKSFCMVTLLLPIIKTNGQTTKETPAMDSLFYGVWKGTSICKVKNSPCHDETVVYYISKSTKNGIIEVKANKIVNGAEEEMGKIQFQYDAKTEQIISIPQPGSVWKFKRKKNSLEGTLYHKDELYRIINLVKQ